MEEIVQSLEIVSFLGVILWGRGSKNQDSALILTDSHHYQYHHFTCIFSADTVGVPATIQISLTQNRCSSSWTISHLYVFSFLFGTDSKDGCFSWTPPTTDWIKSILSIKTSIREDVWPLAKAKNPLYTPPSKCINCRMC